MNQQELSKLHPSQIKELYRQLQERRGGSKHTIFLSKDGRYTQYSLTKRRPWTLKVERRAAAKRAKQARKLNR